mmetsp:Transcript_124451/g.278180  ORF Transcript_124451/g.278180 Transcript_124451/m.278180 type:complete len:292 (-) Transcript_124451:7-882(-)
MGMHHGGLLRRPSLDGGQGWWRCGWGRGRGPALHHGGQTSRLRVLIHAPHVRRQSQRIRRRLASCPIGGSPTFVGRPLLRGEAGGASTCLGHLWWRRGRWRGPCVSQRATGSAIGRPLGEIRQLDGRRRAEGELLGSFGGVIVVMTAPPAKGWRHRKARCIEGTPGAGLPVPPLARPLGSGRDGRHLGYLRWQLQLLRLPERELLAGGGVQGILQTALASTPGARWGAARVIAWIYGLQRLWHGTAATICTAGTSRGAFQAGAAGWRGVRHSSARTNCQENPTRVLGPRRA